MSKEKTVNYTPEQTAELVAAYTGADGDAERAAVVESFAESFSKKAASIRAKLVRERVYIKPARVNKKSAARKADIVAIIADVCGTPDELLNSLEKATAWSLQRVADTLFELREEKDNLVDELNGSPNH